jgi:PAS domain S-box-containing protein
MTPRLATVGRALGILFAFVVALLALRYVGVAEDSSNLMAIRAMTSQLLFNDSQFREQVLRNRFGVDANYDGLVAQQAILLRGLAKLKTLPAPDDIRQAIAAYEDLVRSESEQVESFKSLNATLRNATRYYQYEARRLLETLPDTPADRQLKLELHRYSLETFRLLSGQRTVEAGSARPAIESALTAAAARMPARRVTFAGLGKHVERIESGTPRLFDITRSLLRIDARTRLERIQDLTDSRLAREARDASAQRQLLGAVAAILLAALAFVAHRRVRDVKARLAAEEKTRELSQAVEQSPNVILVTDLEGNIEYVNAALEKTTGYSQTEAVGANMRVLRSGKTPTETYRDLWQTLAAGGIWQGEFINRRKDGSEYVGAAVIGPVRQPDGTITHYVGVQEDVTEKKRVAAELAQYRDHLEELVALRTTELTRAVAAAEAANIAKSRFLATMSHELRTPMNGVLGMAQLLLAGPVTEAETKEYAGTILQSGQSLMTLLNDILDISKVESGKLVLEQAIISPANVLSDVATLFAGNAKAKSLALHTHWAGHAGRLYRGDLHRLRQMLSNLVDNAVKFSAAGEVRIEALELESDGTSALIEFSVRDTGIGIATDKQSLLFQPFSQVDSSTTREYGGTGLGLSIVHSLARLMGGDVGVESSAGEGARFWFRVRLEIDAAAPFERAG